MYVVTPKHRVVALDAATGVRALAVRLRPRGPGTEPRRHLLEVRRRRADLRGTGPVPVRDRRAHRPRRPRLRTRRAHRPARAPRPPGREAGRAAHEPLRRLRGPRDRRRTRGRGPALVARARPRLRREDGRPALDLPHHPASGRVRLRDVAEGRLEGERRRQQLAGHGGRRGARARLRADRLRRGRLLRREPARRQPLREHAAGARRAHRQARVALPGRAPRHLGPRLPRAAEPRDRRA